jgi:acyl-[acyl-carrier-protein] desaturase
MKPTINEVMTFLNKEVDAWTDHYLKDIKTNWQPSDFLPDSTSDTFIQDVIELRELSKELPDDFFVVLVGDTITEEALPTYETWLMHLDGVDIKDDTGWSKWVRGWTGEENRHGDLLNKYLYLTGRVNMREVEVSTQHLIADGYDIETGTHPYKNFVYTSFQELATKVSHMRVGNLAKMFGNKSLSRMCKVIAADEGRHATAYKHFVKRIFEVDPNEMMLSFADMMKRKITMPAHYMRESGGPKGDIFERFSETAQQLGVYTFRDYIDIMDSLIQEWKIEEIVGLNDQAERARDYLVKLPSRFERVLERMKLPEINHDFKWIIPSKDVAPIIL